MHLPPLLCCYLYFFYVLILILCFVTLFNGTRGLSTVINSKKKKKKEKREKKSKESVHATSMPIIWILYLSLHR